MIMYSCSTAVNEVQPVSSKPAKSPTTKAKRYYIIYATWDSWGRTSRNCRGWGLCNFAGCAFCCVDNGVIVNCETGNAKEKAGKIVIDEETNKGYMCVELNPLFTDQKDAISNSSILYIDQDLENNGIVIDS
jgi:hypothetical protein